MANDSEQGQHQCYVDVEQRLVVMQIRGRVTLESLLEMAEGVYAREDYDPSFDGIVDIQTTDWAIDYVDITEYSQYISSNPKVLRGRVVFVATTPIAYGFGRIYEGAQEFPVGDLHFEPTIEAAIAHLRATSQ